MLRSGRRCNVFFIFFCGEAVYLMKTIDVRWIIIAKSKMIGFTNVEPQGQISPLMLTAAVAFDARCDVSFVMKNILVQRKAVC